MKVALCCIGRLENNYAREFVEYYLGIGVDHIFVYDNNNDDEDNFHDVIGDYVLQGVVDIIPYNKSHFNIQRMAYQDCFEQNKKDYDWMMFFDFDEFLTLVQHKTVQEYLSENIFNNVDCIHINWMGYSDNNLVEYDGRGVLERFTQPCVFDYKKKYSFPENNHIKSIINCKHLQYVSWLDATNPHTPKMNGKCVNNRGEVCNGNSPFNSYNFDVAYIKHFSTKTIDEWIHNKYRRGLLEQPTKKDLSLDVFFNQNEKTVEKLQYIEKIGFKM